MPEGDTVRLGAVGATGRPGPGGGAEQARRIAALAAAGAELVILPQLSFSRYFPARRDRAALELGERLPSAALGAALEGAGGSLLFATVYECVGEGVFYARGELIGAATGGSLVNDRQRKVEAAPGRYEQMFLSPGHGPRRVGEAPWGPTGLLIGADAVDGGAYAELARAGARLVLAGVSEEVDGWQRCRRVAAGAAAAHSVAVAVVNREPAEDEPGFAGGAGVFAPGGRELEPGEQGLYELRIDAEEASGR